MKRRQVRWILAGSTGVLAVGAILGGPRLLRALPLFEVRTVEVSGARLVAPHEVLRAAAIDAGQNIWDDPSPWEEAIERHPAIASATIRRRLPATLRLRIEEKQPVALVNDGALALVTAEGERLPIDPTRAPADLPIVRGVGTDSVPAALLAEVERLAVIAPALMADVSEIRARDEAATAMVLAHPRASLVLPAGVPAGRIDELLAVLADLRRRALPDSAGPVRIDLRFADQVVVRLPNSVQTP